MNGTHALGQIRALGVDIEIVGGALRLMPFRPEAVEIAKEHKPAIITALQLERFDGITYEASGCYHWIERVYDHAKRLSECGIDCQQLLNRLRALDDAMSEKFDRERFDREVSQLRDTAGPIIDQTGYLGGHALCDAVKREAGAIGRDMEAFAA